MTRKRIAIVGAGVSGLTAAYVLRRRHDVTVFEANDYAGGHTHTRPVTLNGRVWPVNTGFIVYNDWTYPNFIELMRQLEVASEPSAMSFSVHNERTGMEYNGTSLDTLFCQRRNLANPYFLRMVADILRFNRQALSDLASDGVPLELSMGDYLRRGHFSDYFVRHYILPMGAAIWSASERDTERMPAQFFLRFFRNHGMLSVDERPTWRVISGGSATYVDAMLTQFGGDVQLSAGVVSVDRMSGGVMVNTQNGGQSFDEVIFACHSDQALALLGEDASVKEREVLSAIRYQDNSVVLHTDESLLPKHRKAWAAWNYRIPSSPDEAVRLTYDMNILQNFDDAPVTFCVSLNQDERIAPSKIIDRFTYAHPMYTAGVTAAQHRFAEISGHQRTHFCGAYWFNGFHEDGVRSALRVCEAFDLSLV